MKVTGKSDIKSRDSKLDYNSFQHTDKFTLKKDMEGETLRKRKDTK